MQLIVTSKLLNKRSAIPAKFSDKSSVVGTVKQGVSFEAEEVTDINSPLGTWYKDRDNHYYWGGGVVEKILSQPVLKSQKGKYVFNSSQMSWAHAATNDGGLGIVDLWNQMGVRGENIGIAILDTGVNKSHPDLADRIIGSWNFVNDTADASDNDGHGTQMAGIIAASGKSFVYGVAPQSHLYCAKVMENAQGEGASLDGIANALRAINKLSNIHLISISLDISDDEIVHTEIINCVNNGKIVVAAIGNHTGDNPSYDIFPAKYIECISIGAVDKTYQILNNCNKKPYIRLLSPGKDILTTSNNTDYKTLGQNSSIATAFTCGLFSLFLSFDKTINRQELKGIFSIPEADNAYNVINPKDALNKLKKTA